MTSVVRRHPCTWLGMYRLHAKSSDVIILALRLARAGARIFEGKFGLLHAFSFDRGCGRGHVVVGNPLEVPLTSHPDVCVSVPTACVVLGMFVALLADDDLMHPPAAIFDQLGVRSLHCELVLGERSAREQDAITCNAKSDGMIIFALSSVWDVARACEGESVLWDVVSFDLVRGRGRAVAGKHGWGGPTHTLPEKDYYY